ncbi:hypothetical protein D3C74_226100 [compost metagenome]
MQMTKTQPNEIQHMGLPEGNFDLSAAIRAVLLGTEVQQPAKHQVEQQSSSVIQMEQKMFAPALDENHLSSYQFPDKLLPR